ncbi:MAG TPA: hypothetical protein VKE74_34490 [Gemmataceae bacterium]|nr:hypothetical protein [Gemmataceae bacterium]
MFTTTFTALALSGLMAVGNEALVPSWQSDYRTAMQAALAQQKPMAVFIGRGEAGFDRLVSDGKISAESGKLLATDYVCVYVDTSTPAGQTLAGQFQINEGLVISTPGGQIQALRHTGAVSPAELSSYLTKYNHPTNVVSTEYRGVVAQPVVPASGVVSTGTIQPGTVYYVTGGCSGGSCGGG